jgi:hypothetical protein
MVSAQFSIVVHMKKEKSHCPANIVNVAQRCLLRHFAQANAINK